MKAIRFLLLATALQFSLYVGAQKAYKMQNVPIQTRWAKDVSPTNALKEYPRPQMSRPSWSNLNGLWDYAICDRNVTKPSAFDGQILVPYPLESALSGVKKNLLPSQNLWYRRKIYMHSKAGERTLLHFGAVDWQTTVFINGKEVGQHSGGYSAFSIDITGSSNLGENELLVKVYDPTEQGIGPHGKQVLKPENIYYTSTSGIWQTVWLEQVPYDYIEKINLTPNIDKGELYLSVSLNEGIQKYSIEAIVLKEGGVIASMNSQENRNDNGSKKQLKLQDSLFSEYPDNVMRIKIPNARLWCPADPYLYDLVVRLKQNGIVMDEIKSYFGMRKVCIDKDSAGIDRIFLNNKPYFNLGTLDQGFWPEGLYTAPTDEALVYDIKAIKAMGFNTIRKHIKVEPARWYYYTDKLGMLVWQDMVEPNQSLPEGAKAVFEEQIKEVLAQLHNAPSIVCWVLFNEKWGQYDQKRLTQWIKSLDSTRIVNGHSGEMLYVNEVLRSPSPDAYVASDMTDVHSYPDPMMSIKEDGKAQVCGEFGGIGVFIPNHQWLIGSAWGYITEKPVGLYTKYLILNQHIKLMEMAGLSGSIYTQPFDVEGEQNGLMTYDREVIKIPFKKLREIHKSLNPVFGTIPEVGAKDADLTEPRLRYSRLLQAYIDGRREGDFLKDLMQSATQVGDRIGVELAQRAFLGRLGVPFTEQDISFVASFTKSTKDPGFDFMSLHAVAFKKFMGDRKYNVAIMNMIGKGEVEPFLNQENIDWTLIESKVKSFGAPGEEILLRAKTISYYSKQDWSNFIQVAQIYIEKYGSFINLKEKEGLLQAIQQHK